MQTRIRRLVPPFPDERVLMALCLPALDVVTPDVLDALLTALADTGAAPRVDDVQIVVAEALNNIVEHAYSDQAFGAVSVKLVLTDSDLRIDLVDWGAPFPNHAMPEGPAPAPEALSEGGYGWFLIRTLASTTAYGRLANANRLSLGFRLR